MDPRSPPDHRDRPDAAAAPGPPRLRPRWFLVVFLAVQVAIPTVGLVVRWSGGSVLSPFSWHMFSAL